MLVQVAQFNLFDSVVPGFMTTEARQGQFATRDMQVEHSRDSERGEQLEQNVLAVHLAADVVQADLLKLLETILASNTSDTR